MLEKLILEINAPAEKVFQFLCGYDKHYTEVHQDHIERVVNIKDADLEHPDVSFYFRQKSPISGREQKIRGRVTRVEMNRYIGTRFLFPTSLALKDVEEILEPKGEGCVLTTNMHFTFVANLLEKSVRKVVKHIAQELNEMKDLLESKTSF